MAENETKVLYKAIADFSELSKAARAAKKDLRELREEEARLNSASAKGATTSSRARANKTKATKDEAVATQQVASATERVVKATQQAAAATDKAASSQSNAARETGRHAAAVNGLNGFLNNAVSGLQRFTNANDRSAAAQRRNSREIGGVGSAAGKSTGALQKFSKAFDKLGTFRPRLVPPFIALIPVIASLLALIGPLVSGLGAVGGAAIGLASNLGSLGGAALAAIPALASLLSMVAALKVAMGGVGNAFKAFGAAKKAGGGGGGGAPAKAELTQTEEIARANEKLRRSYEDVTYAQEDLDEARRNAVKRLEDLRKAVDRAAMSEARARANAQLSRENYANVLADPGSTKGQKMDAAVSVDEARADVADTLDENKQNLADLIAMQQKGIENDREVIMAQRRLTDAMWAVRDAQLALQNAEKGDGAAGAAGAADLYREALEKLSPSARKVVEFLVSLDEAWTRLQQNVQEAFFSKFVDNIERLKLLLGPVESLLSDTAGAMGEVANKILLMVTSQEWLEDIGALGKQNVPLIQAMGDALLSVLDIFKDLTIIVGPFAQRLADGFALGAKNLETLVDTARDTGQLADWLQKVGDRLSQWWRIIKNIGATLFNFGAAAEDLGQWITDGFEKVTAGWKESSERARQDGSPFRKFLEDIQPLLSSVAGLLGDFGAMFARVAGDPENIALMTDLVERFRDDLLPAIEGIIDTLAESGVGEGLVDTIAKLLEVVQKFLDGGGAEGLGAFFDVLTGFLDVVGKVVTALPDGVVTALVGSLGALSALRFVGLNLLLDKILKVGGKGLFGKMTDWAKKILPGGSGGSAGRHAAGAADDVVAGTGRRALGKPSVLNDIKTILSKGLPKGGAGGAAGILSKIPKGGPLAILAGLTVGAVSNSVVKDGKGGARDAAGSALSGAAAGAGTGALIGSVVPGVGTAVGAVAGGAIGAIGGALSSEAGKEWLDGLWKNISTWVAALPEKIGAIAGNIWEALGGIPTWLGEQWTALVNWVTELPSRLVFAAGYIWQSFINMGVWLEEQWIAFTVWLSELPGRIQSLGANIWTNLIAMAVWLGEQWTNFQNWLIGLPGRIAALGVALWNALPGIINWLGEQWSNFSAWLVTLPSRIGAVAGNIWSALGGVGPWLADQWAAISGWITSLPSKVAAAVSSLGGNFADWLSGTFSAGRTAANNAQGRNRGGPIYRSEGGGVPGSGHTDTVPAMLTPGEYVLRKGIVNQIGEENLSLLNRGVLGLSGMLKRTANQDRPKGNVAYLNSGGMVPGLPGFTGGGAVSQSTFSNIEGGSGNFVVENLNVNNPVPETASESLPRTIRKVSYMGSRR